jgi:hypothetical protein
MHNMGITGCGRWIPVTERLPPHDETVLYTCDLGPNEGFTDVESGRWEGARNDTGLPAMRPVWGDVDDWGPCSHWMPLPAPPTAAAVANDPVREGEPQTLPPRETWPAHIRSRDEATDEPSADELIDSNRDGPGDGYRWLDTTEIVQDGDEWKIGGQWVRTNRVGKRPWPATRRRVTPAEAVPGDGWRFVNVVGCRWCRER